MKLLFIDTETNGLPQSRWTKESEWAKFPEIVQLGWEVWEVADGVEPKIIESEDYILIQEDGILWSKEAEAVHKIPLTLCQTTGKSPKIVLEHFQKSLLSCHGIVAHNLEFDRRIVRAQMYRYGIEPWQEGKVLELCTMSGATGFFDFGLNKLGEPKPPRLQQLHNACIPGTFDCSGAGPWHSATHDLHCAALCFWVMCHNEKSLNILLQATKLTGRKWKKSELTTLQHSLIYTGA
jgi:DNA polymerase III epsilon subunit-like protein